MTVSLDPVATWGALGALVLAVVCTAWDITVGADRARGFQAGNFDRRNN